MIYFKHEIFQNVDVRKIIEIPNNLTGIGIF